MSTPAPTPGPPTAPQGTPHSSAPSAGIARSMYKDGQIHYEMTGVDQRLFSDLYHQTLRMPFPRLIGLGFLGYLAINLIFASLYRMGGDCLTNARAGSFMDDFYFSVQTVATIGYGGMLPKTPWANFLVTVESFVGLVSVAIGTGLMFAKFSRPVARVAFSSKMVVHDRNGVPCLLFRMANERHNQIVEARLAVTALIDEVTAEGQRMRRGHQLKLERDYNPMFAISWTAIHRLDGESPLFGLNEENVHEKVMSLIAIFTGIDDTFNQNVHARQLYLAENIVFNSAFVDMLIQTEGGGMRVEHERLNEVRPLPPKG